MVRGELNHLLTKAKPLEQLKELDKNGKIGIWKWTEPKREEPNHGRAETQPVQTGCQQ